MPRHRSGALPSRLLAVLGLCLLAVALFGTSTTHARLEPYYILQGVSFGQTNPRILFVLDSSGSMTWRAKAASELCAFQECEGNDGDKQSRIHAARTAIATVVDATEDGANFSLMTFDQLESPGAKGQIPSKCGNGQNQTRFSFYSRYGDDTHALVDADLHGFAGGWRLCGDNRPYPYLRWDDLGVGSVINADDQNGDPPDSPLISTSFVDFARSENADRPVQWFPNYLGVRVNLNDGTDPDQEILDATWGDLGDSPNTKLAEVWEQDFYYWPYVDGFPGYSHMVDDDDEPLGVVEDDTSAAAGQLYGPFFLESAIQAFSQADRGPASLEESRAEVLARTSELMTGGVDAGGDTPWFSVIGPIIQAPPQSNAVFAHTTVASYLRFAQNVSQEDACVPTISVLITDGDPSPANQGGSGLHSRLSALRTSLGVKTYVVGFFHATSSLNDMACAAAGSSNDNSPCTGTSAKNWDTCFDSSDPSNSCAYLANSVDELTEALTNIVEGELEMDVGSGPGTSVNDFGIGANGQSGEGDFVQTSVAAHTEWPGWRGHVVRGLCDDPDPDDPNQLAPWCQAQAFDEAEATFGPCPQSRAWNAGECLQQTTWNDRRLYVNDDFNRVWPVANPNGTATAAFLNQLNDGDLGIPGAPFDQNDADAIVGFILGKDWPDDWKLPGLANSAPIVLRRIPRQDPEFSPSVGIRDPHCAGRRLSADSEVHETLVDFAKDTWDEDLKLNAPSEHYEYQEAVLVGDDLGVLHAFQLDSGNELWGLIPRTLLASAVAQFGYGPSNMGQPSKVDDHLYGIAATMNHGWSWDENADNGDGAWRHLAVIGMGKGGRDYMTLDLAHMSPNSPDGPIEILWTTDDAANAATYAPLLGETWARPALSYSLPPNDDLGALPETYLVFGSGYPSNPATGPTQGRTLVMANALTGEIEDSASLAAPNTPLYESLYGSVVDPAVGTHCVSRYWGEMQEVYLNDPAGRLYRWDLGRDEAHVGDSGGVWGGSATPVFTFLACQSTDSYSCSISNGNAGDPFIYSPAIVSNDRIDDGSGGGSGAVDAGFRDQFLVAMVSGSPYDDSLDGLDDDNDYHSSIYLLADDHRDDGHGGFDIANDGKTTPAGSEPSFFRLALSDIERTRTYQPLEDGPVFEETRFFSKAARPIRAPSIRVTGLVEDNGGNLEVVEGIEVYYIEYTIYEPGERSCDAGWYDEDTEEWVFDSGSTYTIRLRLTAEDGKGFDFQNGGGQAFGDGYGFAGAGLELGEVEQVLDGNCANGVCGPNPGTKANLPCDPNADEDAAGRLMTVPIGWSELTGFSPLEMQL